MAANEDVGMSEPELKQAPLPPFLVRVLPPEHLLNEPEESHEALVYACITVPEDVKPLIRVKTGVRIRGDVQALVGRGIFKISLGAACFKDCFGKFNGSATFDIVPSYRSTPCALQRL
jgi:hypothetical protein